MDLQEADREKAMKLISRYIFQLFTAKDEALKYN